MKLKYSCRMYEDSELKSEILVVAKNSKIADICFYKDSVELSFKCKDNKILKGCISYKQYYACVK